MDYAQSVEYVVSAPLFGSKKNGLHNIRTLLARLGKYRGRLPADVRFDRLEANERR